MFYRVFFVQPACGDMTFAIIPHYRKQTFHTDYLKKAIVFLARYHDTFILFAEEKVGMSIFYHSLSQTPGRCLLESASMLLSASPSPMPMLVSLSDSVPDVASIVSVLISIVSIVGVIYSFFILCMLICSNLSCWLFSFKDNIYSSHGICHVHYTIGIHICLCVILLSQAKVYHTHGICHVHHTVTIGIALWGGLHICL